MYNGKEVIKKLSPRQIAHRLKLKGNNLEIPHNRLNNRKNCQSSAMLGLAVSVSTIGLLLAPQQKQVLAATDTFLFNNHLPVTKQITSYKHHRREKSNKFAIFQHPPLSSLIPSPLLPDFSIQGWEMSLFQNRQIKNTSLSELPTVKLGKLSKSHSVEQSNQIFPLELQKSAFNQVKEDYLGTDSEIQVGKGAVSESVSLVSNFSSASGKQSTLDSSVTIVSNSNLDFTDRPIPQLPPLTVPQNTVLNTNRALSQNLKNRLSLREDSDPSPQKNASQLSIFSDYFHKIYTIQPGDTLNEVAEQHGVSRQQLIEVNNIQDPDLIFVAQQIKIPRLSLNKNSNSQTIGSLSLLEDKKLRFDSFPAMGGATTIVAQLSNREDRTIDYANDPHISQLRADIVKLREQYSQQSKGGSFNEIRTNLGAINYDAEYSVEIASPLRQPKILPFETIERRDNSQNLNLQPQLSPVDYSEENLIGKATNGAENYNQFINVPWGATVAPELPPLSSPEQYLPSSPAAEFDGYIWPAKGTLTSGYGWRWGRLHKGIDIAAPIGTPIIAAASGEVISAGWNSGGYGNLVKVKHEDGSVTFYAHNNRIFVRHGQRVEQGQQIAEMGSTGFSTGPHLHFEIRSNGGKTVNPVAFLPKN